MSPVPIYRANTKIGSSLALYYAFHSLLSLISKQKHGSKKYFIDCPFLTTICIIAIIS